MATRAKPFRADVEPPVDAPPPSNESGPPSTGGSTGGPRIRAMPDVDIPDVFASKFGVKELRETYFRIFSTISQAPFVKSDAEWNDAEFDKLADASLTLANKVKAVRVFLRFLGWCEAPLIVIDKVKKMMATSQVLAARRKPTVVTTDNVAA